MIMVTGATGNIGREVVRGLLEAGEQVAAVTRDPTSAALPGGALLVPGDPSQPETLGPAVRDVEALLLIPRAVGTATAELLSLARERGVERVVLVSATTVTHGGGDERFANALRAAEDAVRASGLRWTILNCADFSLNAMVWASQIRTGDAVRGAFGDAVTSPIHEHDLSEVAVRALTEAGHAGRAHLLTGPQPLSQRDRVRLIGSAIGRDLVWEETSSEEVRGAMIGAGLPEEAPDRLLGYLAGHVRRPGPTSTAVGEILARPPLTFAEWAAHHARAFRG
ncbi:MAG TPA: NAD(P)H-binding protein [Candidatus Dormibacteraeota bacterium]|jgi:uncharacterized protein YbjT (DUF2867 family)|nr:NAD(P)H-binding protein [Candidatus Dormibacteraeota bacterium]